MVETVSEFKARVQRVRMERSHWREGQAYWLAMWFQEATNATPEQARWANSLDVSSVAFCPLYDNRRIPAFIAAAVKAGVLREDDK